MTAYYLLFAIIFAIISVIISPFIFAAAIAPPIRRFFISFSRQLRHTPFADDISELPPRLLLMLIFAFADVIFAMPMPYAAADDS